MVKNITLFLTCASVWLFPGCSAQQQISASALSVQVPAEAGAITITGDGFELVSRWSDPLLASGDELGGQWQHEGRESGSLVLAGVAGKLVTDAFTAPGLHMSREVWTGRHGEAAAVRLTLTNTGDEDIRLKRLVPISCDSSPDLSFTGQTFDGWRIFTQQRLKNGRPGTFLPDSALSLDSDPFMLIDGGGDTRLILGFISQDYHLAGVRLNSAAGPPAALESLRAECEFDGVLVGPGEKRASQWCYVSAGSDENELITDFAERMAVYHDISQPPDNAPSVFCSWYYWGPWFSELDLANQLEHLGRERVPFDVFLIDDCWSWHWGDWFPNDKWEGGMRQAAAAIHAAGYRAGVWTCPTLANDQSAVAAEHPEWLLRLDDGGLMEFKMDGTNYVLDPTYPGVVEHIEEIYRRLVRDCGFDYLKLDFMRSVFVNPKVRFHDPKATRLEAYRLALDAIRAGAGPDCYISVCGGHFGASLGIADSQRSGSDVVGFWRDIVPFKQNVLRTWMNRMWHVDADAMMVRREEEPREEEGHGILNVGRLTDTEARTVAINQYLCGDMVTFCEDFRRLDPDRLALYRHVIPTVNSPAVPLDLLTLPCPSKFLTRVKPVGDGLASWNTLTLVNWTDEEQTMAAGLDSHTLAGLDGDKFLVFDMFNQQVLGIFPAGAEIGLGVLAPHASALLRVAPWDGKSPVLAGTDLHYSGGGVEIGSWRVENGAVTGAVDTGWVWPVKITVAIPTGDSCETRTVTVEPGSKTFRIDI